jgi:hypothetical protein
MAAGRDGVGGIDRHRESWPSAIRRLERNLVLDWSGRVHFESARSVWHTANLRLEYVRGHLCELDRLYQQSELRHHRGRRQLHTEFIRPECQRSAKRDCHRHDNCYPCGRIYRQRDSVHFRAALGRDRLVWHEPYHQFQRAYFFGQRFGCCRNLQRHCQWRFGQSGSDHTDLARCGQRHLHTHNAHTLSADRHQCLAAGVDGNSAIRVYREPRSAAFR